MFNKMSKDAQAKLKEKFFKEYEDTVREYGIEPTVTGPYALVRMFKPEKTSNGGIIIPVDDRDQEAMSVGMVIDFGPTACAGYGLPGRKATNGPQDYGINKGDFVQFDAYEGRLCTYAQFKNYRVLPAQTIRLVYKELS